MSADDGPGQREIAYRVFAAEYDDCTVEHKESDEERAPNYVVSPTGARLNRLFAVGVLTEVEQVNEDTKRARIVDPTGAFVVYAGQYQPDAVTALERIDAPAFVAVTGKANTFSPEDSERVFTSIRPESINEVDAETRDRWTVTTAEHTLARVATMADALTREERGTDLRAALEAEGVEPGVAAGVPLAIDHYGTTPGYLAAVRDLAIDAAEVVADEREEVRPLSLSPDDRGTESVDLAALAAGPDSGLTGDEGAAEPAAAAAADGATAASATSTGASADAAADAGADTTVGTASETASETADTETADAADVDDAATDDAASTTGTAEAGGDDASVDAADAVETAAPAGEAGSAGDTADATDTAAETADATDATTDDPTPATDGTDAAAAEPTADATASGDDDAAAADPGSDGTGPDDDDLGDFEPGGLGDEDGEMYEMDEEERQQVKEEHGVEFSTGNEVSDPGEADIDAPDPEDLDEGEAAAADGADGTASESDAGGETADATADGDDATAGAEGTADAEGQDTDDAETDEPADDAGGDADEAAGDEADADPEAVLMDAMRELNDGDGAPRDELVATVAERTGGDEAAVEDAIQDALMGGQCYESGDDRLTPI